MAPPPATPNPHRFAPLSKHPYPPTSSTRSRGTLTPGSHTSKQFASTPRFSFGSAPRPSQTPGSAAHALETSFSPAPLRRSQYLPTPKPSDDIEDTIFELGTQPPSTTKSGPTIEDPPSPPEPPAQKRRRLTSRNDDPIAISSSASPPQSSTSSSPAARSSPPPSSPLPSPTSPLQHTTPFILSPKRPHHFTRSDHLPSHPHLQTQTQTQTPTQRPSFVLPPRSPSPPPFRDLNPIFSPHRKGARFLPGGIAGTVRDWLVDIASTSASRQQWAQEIKLGDVKPGRRTVLAEEEEVDGEDRKELKEEERKKWVLVAEGRGRELANGDVAGVKKPLWDVDVQGEKWWVGVEWGVLKHSR